MYANNPNDMNRTAEITDASQFVVPEVQAILSRWVDSATKAVFRMLRTLDQAYGLPRTDLAGLQLGNPAHIRRFQAFWPCFQLKFNLFAFLQRAKTFRNNR